MQNNMHNLPWEPCPRCGSKSVEVTTSGGQRAGWVGVTITVFCLAAVWFWVKSKLGFEPNPFDALIIAPIVVLAFPIAAVIGGAIGVISGSVGRNVYYGKCRDCSYQWEIKGAEQSPAPSDTTQAH